MGDGEPRPNPHRRARGTTAVEHGHRGANQALLDGKADRSLEFGREPGSNRLDAPVTPRERMEVGPSKQERGAHVAARTAARIAWTAGQSRRNAPVATLAVARAVFATPLATHRCSTVTPHVGPG